MKKRFRWQKSESYRPKSRLRDRLADGLQSLVRRAGLTPRAGKKRKVPASDELYEGAAKAGEGISEFPVVFDKQRQEWSVEDSVKLEVLGDGDKLTSKNTELGPEADPLPNSYAQLQFPTKEASKMQEKSGTKLPSNSKIPFERPSSPSPSLSTLGSASVCSVGSKSIGSRSNASKSTYYLSRRRRKAPQTNTMRAEREIFFDTSNSSADDESPNLENSFRVVETASPEQGSWSHWENGSTRTSGSRRSIRKISKTRRSSDDSSHASRASHNSHARCRRDGSSIRSSRSTSDHNRRRRRPSESGSGDTAREMSLTVEVTSTGNWQERRLSRTGSTSSSTRNGRTPHIRNGSGDSSRHRNSKLKSEGGSVRTCRAAKKSESFSGHRRRSHEKSRDESRRVHRTVSKGSEHSGSRRNRHDSGDTSKRVRRATERKGGRSSTKRGRRSANGSTTKKHDDGNSTGDRHRNERRDRVSSDDRAKTALRESAEKKMSKHRRMSGNSISRARRSLGDSLRELKYEGNSSSQPSPTVLRGEDEAVTPGTASETGDDGFRSGIRRVKSSSQLERSSRDIERPQAPRRMKSSTCSRESAASSLVRQRQTSPSELTCEQNEVAGAAPFSPIRQRRSSLSDELINEQTQTAGAASRSPIRQRRSSLSDLTGAQNQDIGVAACSPILRRRLGLSELKAERIHIPKASSTNQEKSCLLEKSKPESVLVPITTPNREKICEGKSEEFFPSPFEETSRRSNVEVKPAPERQTSLRGLEWSVSSLQQQRTRRSQSLRDVSGRQGRLHLHQSFSDLNGFGSEFGFQFIPGKRSSSSLASCTSSTTRSSSKVCESGEHPKVSKQTDEISVYSAQTTNTKGSLSNLHKIESCKRRATISGVFETDEKSVLSIFGGQRISASTMEYD